MSSDFTIFLIDDDPAVLKSLDRLLQAAGYETKAYLSAETFLSEHDPSTPGCAVLDLALPHLNGLHVQQALTRQGNNRPVIFLTGQASIQESVEAMKAGATDFLTKPVDKSELLRAIKFAVERDKTQRHDEARHKMIVDRMAKLTPREREALKLVTDGLLNKQIGGIMGVTEKTIKVHRSRVFKKMGAKNLAELVRMTAEYFQERSNRLA
jgi:FixJ family two-component response regulator